MISRREAKEIADYINQIMYKRGATYLTDGKLDLSKAVVGTISGTASYGGPLADAAVYDRHVAPNADVQGTKVREGTTSERGTVKLAADLGTTASTAVQGNDSRLHTAAVADSTDHDGRYFTETELSSVSGASLVGVTTVSGVVGDNVQEILEAVAEITLTKDFLSLVDTPSSYAGNAHKVATVKEDESGIEFTVSSGISFLGLVDTPNDYSGYEKKLVKVGTTSLEFSDVINIDNDLSIGEHSGVVTSGVAAEGLSYGDSVILNSSGTWEKTDKNIENKSDGHLGIVVEAASVDEVFELLLYGYVASSGWSFTTGSAIYLSVSGELTMDVPVTGFSRTVGFARATNVVFYSPDNTIIELA